MYVLIRPGPYVCAEWNFGGLPPYLLSYENMKIRTRNEDFLRHTQIYLTQVLNQI